MPGYFNDYDHRGELQVAIADVTRNRDTLRQQFHEAQAAYWKNRTLENYREQQRVGSLLDQCEDQLATLRTVWHAYGYDE